jgi:UDP-glucose 4-epimerase
VKVLIPGIAGAVAQKVALRLHAAGHTVSGIDIRPWWDVPKGIEVHAVDIRKRAAEDVFRRFRPECVVHMATVTHLQQRMTDEQLRVNLGGTRAVFDHAVAYGVKQVIFVGRHTFYGAAPDSPLYHTEDEPPLQVARFAELADLVAADLFAGSALWRHPELDTAVLRLVYTLGKSHHGTLGAYLSRKRVPTVLGFDPLFQFLSEDDAARAITLAIEKRLRGVFNVAGVPPLPLGEVIRIAQRTAVPIPEPLFQWVLGRFGLVRLPAGAVEHLKFSCVVDPRAFQRATGFTPEHDADEAIRSFRAGDPAGRG